MAHKNNASLICTVLLRSLFFSANISCPCCRGWFFSTLPSVFLPAEHFSSLRGIFLLCQSVFLPCRERYFPAAECSAEKKKKKRKCCCTCGPPHIFFFFFFFFSCHVSNWMYIALDFFFHPALHCAHSNMRSDLHPSPYHDDLRRYPWYRS